MRDRKNLDLMMAVAALSAASMVGLSRPATPTGRQRSADGSRAAYKPGSVDDGITEYTSEEARGRRRDDGIDYAQQAEHNRAVDAKKAAKRARKAARRS